MRRLWNRFWNPNADILVAIAALTNGNRVLVEMVERR